jgi:hypothetical protein
MQTIQDNLFGDDEPQVMQVRVVNLNDFDIKDMFNGIPYTFSANGLKPQSLPIDAANHIFGWFPTYRTEDKDGNIHVHKPDPVEMKRHIMKRWGWNTPSMMEGSRGQMFYENIKLDPIKYRMVPIEVDEEGNPLKSSNGRAPKTNKLMDAAAERALS